ncbi:TPA: hypothetical protein ACSTLY_003547 [Serratia fonticola]|nr:hypothetical protein [Serratia fonticola]CAI1198517.1 Uncharacterised protein [Serratia fonticola]
MFSRTGVSVRTSAGVYTTDEPVCDQRGRPLLPELPPDPTLLLFPLRDP